MPIASVVAAIEESKLEKEFEAACNDPKGLDCGFQEQRACTGFANFNYPPDKAAEMREKELARIAAELENEKPEYDEEDDVILNDDDLLDDDGDLPPLDDEDDEFDRFADSVDLDDVEDDVDNWE